MATPGDYYFIARAGVSYIFARAGAATEPASPDCLARAASFFTGTLAGLSLPHLKIHIVHTVQNVYTVHIVHYTNCTLCTHCKQFTLYIYCKNCNTYNIKKI